MALHSTTEGWGLIARLFHWVMAVMILLMLAGGLRMSAETDLIERFNMVQQHKSIGFTVFVLAVLRILWRWRSPRTPTLPDAMPRWQVRASHISHVMLYILIIAIPVSGWLMVTSSPLNDPGAYPTQIRNMVFGLFEMPDPFATGNEALICLCGLLSVRSLICLCGLLSVLSLFYISRVFSVGPLFHLCGLLCFHTLFSLYGL